MKLSSSFFHTSQTDSGDSENINYRLLTRGGYIDQVMAGAYSYLPLGLKVLRKIEQIVREEMNALGASELLMPVLQPASIWKTSGGWDSIDILFKLKSRTGKDYALAQSAEEVVTQLVLSRYQSHKDLPAAVYQIHWKYRDELRAKSGIMRGREFYMKDMYSFHADQADFEQYYQRVKEVYLRIYQRMGLTAKTTEASGGTFTDKISYEFMVLTDAGEDEIYYCDSCDFAVNTEIAKVEKGGDCPRCNQDQLKQARASEVGNVFDLGQKFPRAFGLTFQDGNNKQQYPVMGCYGIGISRLMGVIVEKYNDEKGILWPASVAPAQAHLIVLGDSAKVKKAADDLYEDLKAANIEVIYDDRTVSAGTKFADGDLLGAPKRLVISSKTLEEDSVEVKGRQEADATMLKRKEVVKYLQ